MATTAGACLAVLFVVLFWRLGAVTFWDPDEAHYAETTRELIETGDWLALYYNEQPFFDKPILFHWLQAVPMAVLGPSEGAARLVPALAALLLVLVTAWAGTALKSRAVGVAAALLLAVNPGLFALARYAILDAVFTLFLFAGASLVSIAALMKRPRLEMPGYVVIGLAVLTKGPLALVLCGLALGFAAALSSTARERLLALRIGRGLATVLAVSLPWFVYMGVRFGRAFVDGYLLDENIRLYAAARFAPTESSTPWFYLRVLAVALLPWTALVAGRLYDDLRAAVRRDGTLGAADVLLWSWTAAVVAFFTFSRFKLDHYVFPAAPSLALIAADSWVALADRPTDPRYRGARIGRACIGPLLLGAATAVGYLIVARLDLPRASLIVPGALAVAGVLALAGEMKLASAPWGAGGRVLWAIVAALTILYAGAMTWAMPAIERQKVVPDVAQWVASHAAPGDRVATYRLNRWNTAFRYYVDRHVEMIDGPEEAVELFSGPGRFYCTMLAPAYEEFKARGAPLRVVYERAGLWATSGRTLWRARPALARFVVVTGQ